MSATKVIIRNDCLIDANGEYRLFYHSPYSDMHIFAAWEGREGADRAGILAVTFDGNPGQAPAVIDMADPTTNSYKFNMRMPFLDFEVSNLPDNGAIRVYVR